MELVLNGDNLTVEQVEAASAHPGVQITLDPLAKTKMSASRALVEQWVNENRVIYGVTTGFGEFANVSISREKLETLQANLIRSHAVGAGDSLPIPVIRAMMILRINALASGFSGIRLSVVERLIEMCSADIIPWVPSQGSVGSSGDLVPLAHLVLGAMGEGNVWYKGILSSASDALSKEGISPVLLGAKEGLALINGTQMMTAFGSIVLARGERLLRSADVIAALSVEALRGTDRAYDERLHRARPHPGQIAVARNMRRLMASSEIRESHRDDDDRVQDAYSLRCIPQVHGACRDALAYVRQAITIEINSATDNPLIFPSEEDYVEGGNFHGEPVALPLDMAAIALSELANISERRTERLVNGALSRLPRFLTEKGGLNSGYMIAQYTSAALVSENKVLSHPASVDSIPTSANQEDHNSMGSIAARKCYQVLKNVESVLSIEYLCAVQGIDLLAPLKPAAALRPVADKLRESVPHLVDDRILHNDLTAALELVRDATPYELVKELLEDDPEGIGS